MTKFERSSRRARTSKRTYTDSVGQVRVQVILRDPQRYPYPKRRNICRYIFIEQAKVSAVTYAIEEALFGLKDHKAQ